MSLEVEYIDGTKIESKANKYTFVWRKTVEKNRANSMSKLECEKNIVNMYNDGLSLDDIFAVSGFTSRSSVFRILNKHGVKLNRGPHSGPIKKRKEKE